MSNHNDQNLKERLSIYKLLEYNMGMNQENYNEYFDKVRCYSTYFAHNNIDSILLLYNKKVNYRLAQ